MTQSSSPLLMPSEVSSRIGFFSMIHCAAFTPRPGHDFTYKDLNTFPVSTSIVRKFGDRYYSVPKDWKPDKGKR